MLHFKAGEMPKLIEHSTLLSKVSYTPRGSRVGSAPTQNTIKGSLTVIWRKGTDASINLIAGRHVLRSRIKSHY